MFAAVGCDAAPTRPEATGATEAISVEAVVGSDGSTALRAGFRFQPGGGVVAIRAPLLGEGSNLRIDGSPRTDPVTDTPAEFRGRGRSLELDFDMAGAVERYDDVAVVTIPLWTVPSDAGRGDDPVPVTGRVELPAAPTDDVHVHGLLAPDARVSGSVVELSGAATSTKQADLVAVVDAATFPGLTVLPGGKREADVARRQAALDREDTHLAGRIHDAERRDDLAAFAYWGGVGLEVGFPFAVAGPRLLRGAARRRRAVADVPSHLFDPPGSHSPAVVALIARDGHDVGREAAAATILDLAHRQVISLDGVTSDRYEIRVPADARGTTGAESAVLDALRHATAGADHLAGPPLLLAEGTWWRRFRRDTLGQAKEGGLVQRRYPSGAFLVAVVALTVTTMPLWGRTPEAAVGGLVVAGVLFMLPFIGGYVLSPAGHRARAEWEAFGRRAAESSEIETVPPRAVAVWGPYLVYSAALGMAPAAVGALGP